MRLVLTLAFDMGQWQVMSQEIQEAIYKQQEVIKDKQLSVKQDLDQVEPAVIEAQNGKKKKKGCLFTLYLSALFVCLFMIKSLLTDIIQWTTRCVYL